MVAAGDGRILSEAAVERMQTNHIGEHFVATERDSG
jgi:hypothetical protein